MRVARLRIGCVGLAAILLLMLVIAFVWQRTSHGNQLYVGSLSSPASIADVAVSPDGTLLAAATNRGLYVWQLPGRQLRWHLPAERGNAITWSPDGRFLATTTFDTYLRIWHVADQVEIAAVAGSRVVVDDLAWSGDGQWLAAASRAQEVRVWQIRDGTVVSALPLFEHSAAVGRVAFSPDSRLLATNGFRAQLRPFPSGASSHSIDGNTVTMVFAPDGATLAVSLGNTVQLRAIGSGGQLADLPRQRDVVASIAYSPGGQFLAFGLGSRYENFGPKATTVQLWRVSEVIRLEDYSGHRGIVTAVTFTPDGRTLVSGSEDGTIRFWEVP